MELVVRNLSFKYKTKCPYVFRDLSFSLLDGEIISILGANGAGKSTLLNVIAGRLNPREGEILLDGESLFSFSLRKRAKRIGYIPQLSGDTFPFSLLEYVVMGRTPYLDIYSHPSPSEYDKASECLRRVGLSGMEDKKINEISGGERQLARIAKTLAQDARIILMDEGANHLDYGNQYRVINIMKSLSKEGYIIINTTHNPDHVLVLGGKAATLDAEGRMHVGKVEDEINSATLTSLYGVGIGTKYVDEAERSVCFVKCNVI